MKIDEGYKEDVDYTELYDIEKQYNFKAVSIDLTKDNLNKYLK